MRWQKGFGFAQILAVVQNTPTRMRDTSSLTSRRRRGSKLQSRSWIVPGASRKLRTRRPSRTGLRDTFFGSAPRVLFPGKLRVFDARWAGLAETKPPTLMRHNVQASWLAKIGDLMIYCSPRLTGILAGSRPY